MHSRTYFSPLGPLTLSEENGALTALHFGAGTQDDTTALLAETARQLDEYFTGRRQDFNLPLCPKGTAFQQKVWQALQQIPFGKTATYKDIAVRIGNPKACRAVGMANHNNPISIIIPCHRVIGCGGSLTGYAGGLDKKQQLLDLEQKFTRAPKV